MHDLVSAIKSLNPFEDNVEALTSVRNDSVRFLSMSFSNMDVVKNTCHHNRHIKCLIRAITS